MTTRSPAPPRSPPRASSPPRLVPTLPTHQIGASLSFAGAVKAVTSLLDANVNYVNVKKVYESVGLSGEAGQKRTGEPYYNAGLKFFKEADWTNTYINTAFDSGSTLATAARLEIIEKTARDNVAVQAIVSDLYKAQAATDADASKILWDHAAAKYLGTDRRPQPDHLRSRRQTRRELRHPSRLWRGHLREGQQEGNR